LGNWGKGALALLQLPELREEKMGKTFLEAIL
jgi:hypothetical protein